MSWCWRSRQISCKISRNVGHDAGHNAGYVLKLRQFIPSELLRQTKRLVSRNGLPMVNRACGARRHAGHATVADIGIHHIIAVIMGDRAHGAGGLAGVAADADHGVNQVLFEYASVKQWVHKCLVVLRIGTILKAKPL